jgi:hypothetical protein
MAAVFFYSDRIAAGIFAGKYDLDIKYSNCSKDFSGRFVFSDLSIMSRPAGLGFTAKSAVIKPSIFDKKSLISFDLKSVNFTKRHGDEPAQYDTLSALVSSPFNSNWQYGRIYGNVTTQKGGVTVNEFEASSDNIRLSLKGLAAYDGVIDSSIVIYFASSLTSKIPPDFANVVLSDASDGWKSLSVKLSGNIKKPSIQVQGKMFRLSIKSAG